MVRALALAFGVALAAPDALALCRPDTKVCSAYFESDKVFFGKVIDFHLIDADGDGYFEIMRFVIKVERALKGSVGELETVETGNDSGRWYANVGERRMLFVRAGRAWGLCSDIDLEKRAKRTIAEILALPKAKYSSVEGQIYLGEDRPEGRTVYAVGADRTYETTTGKGGWFSIRVPPGHYRLDAPGYEPTDAYSRQDSDGFDLAPGQCAQFKLWRNDYLRMR